MVASAFIESAVALTISFSFEFWLRAFGEFMALKYGPRTFNLSCGAEITNLLSVVEVLLVQHLLRLIMGRSLAFMCRSLIVGGCLGRNRGLILGKKRSGFRYSMVLRIFSQYLSVVFLSSRWIAVLLSLNSDFSSLIMLSLDVGLERCNLCNMVTIFRFFRCSLRIFLLRYLRRVGVFFVGKRGTGLAMVLDILMLILWILWLDCGYPGLMF